MANLLNMDPMAGYRGLLGAIKQAQPVGGGLLGAGQRYSAGQERQARERQAAIERENVRQLMGSYYNLRPQQHQPEIAGLAAARTADEGLLPWTPPTTPEEVLPETMLGTWGGGAATRALNIAGDDAIRGAVGKVQEFFDPRMPAGVVPHAVMHASPHRFERFERSPRTANTGEGAQMYGTGLYFAEADPVINSYLKQFANRGPARFRFGSGDELSIKSVSDRVMDDNLPPIGETADTDALERALLDREHLASNIDSILFEMSKGRSLDRVEEVRGSIKSRAPDDKALDDQAIDLLRASGVVNVEPRANLYNVDIPDERLPDFLDWDAKLSEQPSGVLSILREQPAAPDFDLQGFSPEIVASMSPDTFRQVFNAGPEKQEEVLQWVLSMQKQSAVDSAMQAADQMTGRDLYKRIGMGNDDVSTQWLQERGIPGHRYFDAMSRGPSGSSRNMVLYDDALANILRINNVPIGPMGPQRPGGLLAP